MWNTLCQVLEWNISLSQLGLPLPVTMVGIEVFDYCGQPRHAHTTHYKVKMSHPAQQISETLK